MARPDFGYQPEEEKWRASWKEAELTPGVYAAELMFPRLTFPRYPILNGIIVVNNSPPKAVIPLHSTYSSPVMKETIDHLAHDVDYDRRLTEELVTGELRKEYLSMISNQNFWRLGVRETDLDSYDQARKILFPDGLLPTIDFEVATETVFRDKPVGIKMRLKEKVDLPPNLDAVQKAMAVADMLHNDSALGIFAKELSIRRWETDVRKFLSDRYHS